MGVASTRRDGRLDQVSAQSRVGQTDQRFGRKDTEWACVGEMDQDAVDGRGWDTSVEPGVQHPRLDGQLSAAGLFSGAVGVDQ